MPPHDTPRFPPFAAAALAGVALAACSALSGLDDFELGGTSSAAQGGGGGGEPGSTSGSASSGGGGAAGPGSTSTSTGVGAAGGGGAGGGPPLGCGDGAVDLAAGEQCDDGNTVSGDGCSLGCGYELSDGCPNATLVLGATVLTFMGDTTGAMADAQGACGGLTAGDYIFRIQPAASGTLVATLEGTFTLTNQKVLWLHAACPPPQPMQSLACVFDAQTAALSHAVTAGQTYFLGVDGTQGAVGPFVLTVAVQ